MAESLWDEGMQSVTINCRVTEVAFTTLKNICEGFGIPGLLSGTGNLLEGETSYDRQASGRGNFQR